MEIGIRQFVGQFHILHSQGPLQRLDNMVLDIRVIPARNRFVVLHNGVNAVPALQNIQ